jgi:hypothetical protein
MAAAVPGVHGESRGQSAARAQAADGDTVFVDSETSGQAREPGQSRVTVIERRREGILLSQPVFRRRDDTAEGTNKFDVPVTVPPSVAGLESAAVKL